MPAASTLALIAAGVTTVGSISQGIAASKQAQFQATVSEQQAVRARQVSAGAEEDFRRKQAGLLAERRAAMGKAGVEAGTGTALLAPAGFAAETELQALRIRSGGETTATRLEQRAKLSRLAGRTGLARGFTRGGASLLSGFAAFNE